MGIVRVLPTCNIYLHMQKLKSYRDATRWRGLSLLPGTKREEEDLGWSVNADVVY